MVLDARRSRNVVSEFELDNSVIRYGFEVRGATQALRITWAILWNFQGMLKHVDREVCKRHWKSWVKQRLKRAKDVSIELLLDAENANMIREEIEAYVYHAKFVALELGYSPDAKALPDEEREGIRNVELYNLQECLLKIDRHSSAEHLREDVMKAQHLLDGETFYSFVTPEKKAIYSAMVQGFSGAGHWYYCELGHPVDSFPKTRLLYTYLPIS